MPINQLYATLADLAELGPPAAVLAMRSAEAKLRALRAGSAEMARFLRKRHKLPLAVEVEEVTLTGFAGGTAAVSGEPEEAFDAIVRVSTGGAVSGGAVTVQVSQDGGNSYAAAQTLPADGALVVGDMTFTLSGTVATNDAVRARAGVDYTLRQGTVAIAAYRLVYNRGVDAESPEGQELRKLFEDAIQTAKDFGEDAARLESGADATPTRDEAGPRWTAHASPWDFMGGGYIGDDT